MKFPFRLLLTILAVMIAIYILPGITAQTFWAWLAMGVLIAFVNTIPKRLLLKMKIPMNLMVFGFLIFLTNIIVIYSASLLLPNFTVTHFIAALLFSIIITSVTSVMNSIVPSKETESSN